MRFPRYPLITGGPWLLLLLAFFVLPIVGLLLLSLSPGNGSAAAFPTLDNYRGIVDLASGRPQVLARTLGVALGVVLLATLIALPVAYYLAKVVRSTRLQALVLMLVSVTFLVGPLIRTVSWRGILGVKGLINTLLTSSGLLDAPIMALLYGRPAVIAAMTYNSFPFMLFTLFLAMKTIDDRYLVAARDLGASASATFWRIVMPLAAPGLCIGAVLVFVPTLSTVLEPEMLGGTSGRLTTTEIRDQFFHALNWPLGSALTVLLIVVGAVAVGALAALLALFARACGRVGLSLGTGGGRKRPRHLFLLLCTLAMLVYALVPILTVVAFSFNPLPFYAFPITGFTAKWYAALVADPRIGASLLASLGIAALVALLATLLGTLFAFFVVRAQTRFKRLWVAFGFLPLVVPVLVLAAGLQVAFVELGLPLGYPTVIIGHTLYTAPFVALMVMAQLLRYDDRLDEAARDLGASQRQMLRHVTLPILWPSIRSGLLLAFLLSFNEWAIAFFTGRGFNTLPMLIYSMARNGLPPSVLAYSTLAIACVLLVAGMILPFALKLIRGRA